MKSLNLQSPAPLAAQMNIPVHRRNRDKIPCVKSRVVIFDRGNQQFVSPRDWGSMQAVGTGVSWKRVKSDESIIIQNSPGKFYQFRPFIVLYFFSGDIELVVIRNISGNPLLLQSMNAIIETATKYRRDVRVGNSF